jgi:3-(3-hydroxy-phenyl)propionate hydroxylase
MANKFVPVVIIGAGPTGLTAANLLGQYGIETLLVERNTALSDLPRAITIDDEGLRICQALGLRGEVLRHVVLDVGAQYFSRGQLVMRLTPGSRRNGYPLISTFNQPHLEATLIAGLQRFANVEVLFEHTLETFTQTEQEVLLNLRAPDGGVQQITCSYLLACDGAKSLVRRTLGIPMNGMTFPQRWLVLDGFVGEESGPGSYISCFYDHDRPVVSIPAPDQHWRWEFMLRPEEREDLFAQAPGTFPADHLRRMLSQIGDEREPHIVRRSTYTFHASYATSFGRRRVFLLGDAAHLLPPFGGQGMNSGLRDACNLAWKLALVLRGQGRPGILATYEQERMPHVVQMIRFATFLGKQLVMPRSRLRAFSRDIALRALMKLPPVACRMRQMRMKPESFYKSGCVLADDRGHRFPAGRLFPQPTVLLPDKRSLLLDELLGSGFALVRLHSDPKEAFKPLQADIWQKVRPRRICLVPAIEDLQKMCENATCALDGQRQITRFLRGRRDRFALIRPDRHVLGTFRVDREQAFVAALRERFLA